MSSPENESLGAMRKQGRRLPSPGALLLVTGLLIALVLGLVFVVPFVQNLRFVRRIENSHAIVQFSHGEPEWLRNALGKDLRRGIDPITAVCLFPNPHNGSVTREIVAGIQDRHSILGLQLDLTDEELSRLDCPKLESLNLFGSATDDGAVHLLRFPRLKSVNLVDSQMTDAAVEQIAQIPHLRLMEFNSCHHITDAGIEHLKSHDTLEYLQIAECAAISDEALRHAAQIPHLRFLNVQLAPRITDNGIAHLADSSIERLTLYKVPAVSGEGLGELKPCASLRFLMLGGPSYGDEVIPFLSELTHLTTIDLYNTSVTPEGADRLRAALPTCKVKLRSNADDAGAIIAGPMP